MWLEEKYLDFISTRLRNFKKNRNGVYNFSCPYCGDSQKNKRKARGYFYERKGKKFYSCKNCGKGTTFHKFLEWFDPEMYKQYKLELFKENYNMARKKAPKHVNEMNFSTSNLNKFIKPDLLKEFKKVSELHSSHPAKQYVISRNMPKSSWRRIYYVDSMNELASKLDKYDGIEFDKHPRIVLPFINQHGALTHLQGRAIDNVDKTKRYVTLEIIPDTPKVFGIDTVDLSIDNFVTEGPIDSLFLSNASGMGGADVDYSLFDKDTSIFVYDNEPRNAEIIARMEKTLAHGFKVCIWDETFTGKDINDILLQNDVTSDMLESYILEHSYSGMKAKLQMIKFKKR